MREMRRAHADCGAASTRCAFYYCARLPGTPQCPLGSHLEPTYRGVTYLRHPTHRELSSSERTGTLFAHACTVLYVCMCVCSAGPTDSLRIRYVVIKLPAASIKRTYAGMVRDRWASLRREFPELQPPTDPYQTLMS